MRADIVRKCNDKNEGLNKNYTIIRTLLTTIVDFRSLATTGLYILQKQRSPGFSEQYDVTTEKTNNRRRPVEASFAMPRTWQLGELHG